MRSRLITLVAATTSLVALAFVVPLAFLVRELAVDRAVRPAELATRTLAPALALGGEPQVLEGLVAAASSGLEGPVGAVLPDGSTVGAAPPAGVVERAQADRRATQLDVPGGRAVVVPVVSADGVAVVHALVPDAALRRGVTAAWIILGVLASVLVAGAVLLADALARRTLSAIRRVEALAHRLAGGDLEARADVEGPEEVARVAEVLGTLAGTIEDLLQTERERAADLSHRLRTPLTPLRIDAESLPASAQRDRLLADVDALDAEVSRVIRSFRNRPGGTPDGAGCDAAAVAAARAAFWRPLADDEGRRFTVQGPAAGAPVAVAGEELADAVDALLGNVFTHTPEGAPVTFTVELGADVVDITVADDGTGWPGEVEVGDRGASAGGRSTGLGLDICRRAAEAAGGRLRLSTGPSGGAVATIELPLVGGAGAVRGRR